MSETIVVATGNPHKVSEIEAILAPVMPDVEFKALGELGEFDEPEEDGDTFLANALIKARAAAEATGFRAVADDSGLVVDALDGAPGIHSARWCGHHGDDAANNAKLAREMADVPEPERTARFHSCVVLVDPADGSYLAGEGDCEGAIGYEGVGEHGFGYDPFFLPEATPGLTMAQLIPEQKNAISHRFKALQALAAQL
ncbi:RdgB/HAM1 family non-canonical purine NTP pyrophosphatase [Olsenella sp. KGMB02461]|nr:RdgB/HAM1 family non-canonical purine NTP pyrophosphatase [Olsenella sp. KGMB02461]